MSDSEELKHANLSEGMKVPSQGTQQSCGPEWLSKLDGRPKPRFDAASDGAYQLQHMLANKGVSERAGNIAITVLTVVGMILVLLVLSQFTIR